MQDILLASLTQIALRLEKEINDESLSDNLINVRNRARARATLSTVQNVLGDDWLVERLGQLLAFNQHEKEITDGEIRSSDSAD